MLTIADLMSNFSGVSEISGGIVRCQDELPELTYYYYLSLQAITSHSNDFIVVTENVDDEKFAKLLLSTSSDAPITTGLLKRSLPENQYGFSHTLLAAPKFHSYLEGRLDDKRDKLILCLPIHNCEFSGKESHNEFITMRRSTTPTLNWRRAVSPKIRLRFDNPKTGGGTGESYVHSNFDRVLKEVDNIFDTPNGFIELINHDNKVAEVVFCGNDAYYLIRDRNDEGRKILSKENLTQELWAFLTH